MRILEVNDNDIYGKVFNGYDIFEKLNQSEKYNANQLVIHKFSLNDKVIKLYKRSETLDLEYLLNKAQKDVFNIQSILSFNNYFLKNNSYYKKADVVHYHQIHNSHYNLPNLFEMFKTKPTVVTLHDPWFMTGRCVHPMGCEKWKNGCEKCQSLDTLFDFKEDNSSMMWQVKSGIKDTDIDIIVSSQFMYNMVKESPYLKSLRIHLLPFGLDLEKYKKAQSKKKVRQELNIGCEDIVLFFREQAELKGTNYIVEALKNLDFDKNITLLTCSQTGLLEELNGKYNIIEMGNLEEQDLIKCYQAADIFLMPSLGESFGMMAIEAMACSLPVVVFDNTALPSVTHAPDIGILVKNKDSNDLRKKILNLLNNKEEREKRGLNGRKFAEKNYNVDVYYDNLKKVYDEAYENQKYKLQIKEKNTIDHIDFSNIESQRILMSLKNVVNNIYLANYKFDIFEKLYETNCTNVDFTKIKSYDNFLKIVNEFNNELALIIKKIDNKFDFKTTKLFTYLKRNRMLKKIVSLLKRVKRRLSRNKIMLNNLNNQINILKNNVDNLNDKLSILKANNDNNAIAIGNIKDNILCLEKYNQGNNVKQKEILTSIEKIEENVKLLEEYNKDDAEEKSKLSLEISNIKEESILKYDQISQIGKNLKEDITLFNKNTESKIDMVESNFYKMHSLIEYKLWENNKLLNISLYYSDLSKLKKRINFNPLISIIIPTYNGSDFLESAINSALNQTYNNIEIIIVNDGSVDEGKTRDIAKKYNNNNKVYYFEKENGGVSSALNYGIKKMKGEYFSWLSHDDLIENDHIEKLVEFLSYEGNENYIPFSNIKYIGVDGKIDFIKTLKLQLFVSDYKVSKYKNYYSLLAGEINGGSVLIPKKAFDEISLFDEDLRITQERDLWSKLIKHYKFINIPFATSMIRVHNKQVSAKNNKVKLESDKKNLQIINILSKDSQKVLHESVYEMLSHLEYFYYINSNTNMYNEIKKLKSEVDNND